MSEMFSVKKFIMSTVKGMKGSYPDFQIKEYALNWYEKGKLTEEDLAELEEYLKEQVNEVVDETAEGEVSEEITEEAADETAEGEISEEITEEAADETAEGEVSEEITEEVSEETETTDGVG